MNKAERNHYKFAVLYMKLDDFKAINEVLDQAMDVKLLVTIAEQLKTQLQKEDLIDRLGSDEFSICYSNIKKFEDVIFLCPLLLNKVEQQMHLNQHQCNISISIGVSLYPEHGEDYDTLMRVANSSM